MHTTNPVEKTEIQINEMYEPVDTGVIVADVVLIVLTRQPCSSFCIYLLITLNYTKALATTKLGLVLNEFRSETPKGRTQPLPSY